MSLEYGPLDAMRDTRNPMTIPNLTTEHSPRTVADPALEQEALRELVKLSVIVPAYNEASAIRDTLIELR